jgi:hypothetical protein
MSLLSMIFGKKKKEDVKKIKFDKNLEGLMTGKNKDINAFISYNNPNKVDPFLGLSNNPIEQRERTLEEIYNELQQKIKEEAIRILPTEFFLDCLRTYLNENVKTSEEEEELRRRALEKAVQIIDELESLKDPKKRNRVAKAKKQSENESEIKEVIDY